MGTLILLYVFGFGLGFVVYRTVSYLKRERAADKAAPRVWTFGKESYTDAELDVTHPDDSQVKKQLWHKRENSRIADGLGAAEKAAALVQAGIRVKMQAAQERNKGTRRSSAKEIIDENFEVD